LRLRDYERKEFIESLVEKLDALDAQGVVASDVLEMDQEEEDAPLIPIPPEAQPVYHYTKPLGYLLERGLSVKEIFDHEFMYCTKGRYKGRIIIPIRNYLGDIVGFTARGVYRWSSSPKYDTPSAFRISRYMLGEDQIPPACDNVVLVEGPFDKFRLGTNAVATFGKKLSRSQMHKLMELDPSAVTVMLDSDAHEASMKIAALLSHYWPTRVVLLEEGDPGDTSRRKLWGMIAETPLFQSIEWGLREVG
jgi:DNA primase